MALSRKNIIPTPIELRERTKHILSSLVKNDTMLLKLYIRQSSNWTVAKRRQLFRAVFKTLFGDAVVLIHNELRQTQIRTNLYSISSGYIKSRLMNSFIKEIIFLDKLDKFMPEKVYTLKDIGLTNLNINPQLFKYLIKNKIIILSKSLMVSNINNTSILGNLPFRYYQFKSNMSLDSAFEIYKFIGLDPDKRLDTKKEILILLYAFYHNIKVIIEELTLDRSILIDGTSKEKIAIYALYNILDLIYSLVSTDIKYMLNGHLKDIDFIDEYSKTKSSIPCISLQKYNQVRYELVADINKLLVSRLKLFNQYDPSISSEVNEVDNNFSLGDYCSQEATI